MLSILLKTPRHVYCLAGAAITKYPTLWGLNTDIYFSQCWRLQVQGQGVCRFLASLLGSQMAPSPHLHGAFLTQPSCLFVQVSFPCKDTSHIGSGPTLMASFQLNQLCKGPLSKHSSPGVLGVRTSTYESVEDPTQPLVPVTG